MAQTFSTGATLGAISPAPIRVAKLSGTMPAAGTTGNVVAHGINLSLYDIVAINPIVTNPGDGRIPPNSNLSLNNYVVFANATDIVANVPAGSTDVAGRPVVVSVTYCVK